ncbi:MAG: hypothetical protein ABI838_02765 [Chloroflexota bacterium]
MVIAIGLLLVIAGAVLLLNLGSAADAVISRVTSRNLGELAPGYGASRGGFRVYATLVLALGVAVGGLGISPAAPLAGAVGMAVGILAFVVASVVAIRGEVRTYRALPRPPHP